MAPAMSTVLLFFLASFVQCCAGLQLSDCPPCLQENVDHSFECSGASAGDTIVWKQNRQDITYSTFEENIELAECGPTGSSCTSLYPEEFSVTRATSTSSVLTLLNPDRFSYFWKGRLPESVYCSLRSSPSTSSTSCSVNLCDIVKNATCCTARDNSTGLISGGCYIGRAWNEYFDYECIWFEKRGTYPETAIPESSKSTLDYTQDGKEYKRFKCEIQQQMTDVTSAYAYRVFINPGNVEFDVPMSSSCVLPSLYADDETSWCTLDKTGRSCVTLIVVLPLCVLVVVGIRILLCRVRPREDRKGCLEWQSARVTQADEGVPEGKFHTVTLWCACVWYYFLCCCWNVQCLQRKAASGKGGGKPNHKGANGGHRA